MPGVPAEPTPGPRRTVEPVAAEPEVAAPLIGAGLLAPPPARLWRNRSFFAFLGTQGLGAFNDNVFKQVVLLLCVGQVAFGAPFQMIVQIAFALPFLLFSGLAGEIADRYSKGRLMVIYKVAEIAAMALGVLVFFTLSGSEAFLWALAGVTFVMGTQSAFFGPAKYGGLPELVRHEDLSAATGFTQMVTFVAIILGVSLAGWLADTFAGRLAVTGLAAVLIAGAGTATSAFIARRPATEPARRIGWRSLFGMLPTLGRIWREDRLLLVVMLVYSWFWLVGGVALTAINAYGLLQLGLTKTSTGLLVAVLSLGIAGGSVLAGRLSRGRVRLGLAVPGVVALCVFLVALLAVPVHAPTGADLDAYREAQQAGAAAMPAPIPKASTGAVAAAAFVLAGLGAAGGFFALPLLAFIQARPRPARKGQVFAATNWLNWVFILGSAAVYGIGQTLTGWRAEFLLAGLGGATALVGVAFVPYLRRRAAL